MSVGRGFYSFGGVRRGRQEDIIAVEQLLLSSTNNFFDIFFQLLSLCPKLFCVSFAWSS